MSNETKKLVITVFAGPNEEKASVALSVANGGIAAGMEVTLFLVGPGVDIVRRGAAEVFHPNPLDPPIRELLANFMAEGGKIWACPPCAKVRGYTQDHLIDGVTIVGSAPVHQLLIEGASALSF